MRISKQEQDTIKSVIQSFDEKAQIYLFGSRTDDTKKGGDIDLLVISEKLEFKHKIEILAQFFLKLPEEQKIDIVIRKSLEQPNDAFLEIIKENIVVL
jgi:predicted nucleotidyltransferase